MIRRLKIPQLLRKLIVILLFSVGIQLRYCDSDKNIPAQDKPKDIFELNQYLAKSINLGNALEAPNEGDWGVTLVAAYFDSIAAAGFTGVRVPIRWSAHADASSPYTIASDFFQRIDWVIAQCQRTNLAVIIDLHHYSEIFSAPESQRERFLAIWRQIAKRYQDLPDDVFFEILNEPNDQLTAALWNEYLAAALAVIRETNPRRGVIIGTAEWGGLGGLEDLVLPDDSLLIVAIHYYDPFQFTHQGAEWVDGSSAWLGTTWVGTTAQTNAITSALASAATWAENHNCPILLGEFGSYSKADLDSRILWTTFVRQQAEALGFSWAYWEFCSGFGIYNPDTNQWRTGLRQALLP